NLSGRFDVQINGKRRPNVGRICMDQFVVDLGPGPVDVSVGDTAVLFGSGANGEPTAQDWAVTLGTINYEVVTSPRGRVGRAYVGGTSR
ncbi:MAG: alanine racemase, partial [Mycolicibacterium sp.]|nr:alanine racemase [Mycolicibacterium sp.]